MHCSGLSLMDTDKAALHAGMEDVNQHTIEVRNGQGLLGGPVVRQPVPLLIMLIAPEHGSAETSPDSGLSLFRCLGTSPMAWPTLQTWKVRQLGFLASCYPACAGPEKHGGAH